MSIQKPQPGDKILIKIGDREYITVIDEDGRQKFPENRIVLWLQVMLQDKAGMNEIVGMYRLNMFTLDELMHFYMDIGYTVEGFRELSFFEDLKIENPLDA